MCWGGHSTRKYQDSPPFIIRICGEDELAKVESRVNVCSFKFCWHYDNVITWKHLPRCWPFVWVIHRTPVNFPHNTQRPVTRSFDVFFDLLPNERLRKQSWGWRFETLSRSLWRHCNVMLWHYMISLILLPQGTHHVTILHDAIVEWKTNSGWHSEKLQCTNWFCTTNMRCNLLHHFDPLTR